MISALVVYFISRKLSWKECMACAAIDPVLVATVVEKAPAHLQNLLLAESACNDITTTLALELQPTLFDIQRRQGPLLFASSY
jgi:NhaP-type Na+/H+ or K+/H+ antiporter